MHRDRSDWQVMLRASPGLWASIGVFVSIPDRDKVRGGSLTLVQVREIFESAVAI